MTQTETNTTARIACDSCQAAMIQGVFCHETGCPNQGRRWDAESQEWVRQRKCFECGMTVDADDACCEDEGCDDCGSLDSANCTCDDESGA